MHALSVVPCALDKQARQRLNLAATSDTESRQDLAFKENFLEKRKWWAGDQVGTGRADGSCLFAPNITTFAFSFSIHKHLHTHLSPPSSHTSTYFYSSPLPISSFHPKDIIRLPPYSSQTYHSHLLELQHP